MKGMLAVTVALALGSAFIPAGCDKGGDGSPGGGTEEVAAPKGDGGCQNVRRFSDWKSPGDRCWDPPLHYCSDGENSAETVGCNQDGTVCCVYPGSCLPCSWFDAENKCGLDWDSEHQRWVMADPADPASRWAPCNALPVPVNLDADGSMVSAHPDCPLIDKSLEICWDDVEKPAGCEQTASDFALAVAEELDGLTSCSGDDGCVLVTPELECPDVWVHLVECPMAVNAQSSGAFVAGIASLAETFCAPGAFECVATPGCAPGEAKCVEGQCQLVLGEP